MNHHPRSDFRVNRADALSAKRPMTGTATVTKADIKAKNGVVHVIDTVLVPTTK